MPESEPDKTAAESASQAADPASPPAPPSLEEQLMLARQEAAANYDRYLRAVADLENTRRRTVREKEELRQFAATNLLHSLLPVLDNIQLGLSAAPAQTDAKTIADGFALVLGQLKDVLSRNGLTEVDPSGQRFDPHRHEAVSHQPSDKVPEGHVLQVVRSGYLLNGRLLRPASVIVSSGPAKEAR